MLTTVTPLTTNNVKMSNVVSFTVMNIGKTAAIVRPIPSPVAPCKKAPTRTTQKIIISREIIINSILLFHANEHIPSS